jgi:predicted Zn-dependent protease
MNFKKTIFEGFITVIFFVGIWYALMQIDWINVIKLDKASEKSEQELGEILWDVFEKSEKEIKNQFVVNTIDSIVTMVCEKNHIERETIKIHIVQKDEVNAFALPNGHLVVYSGLILNSDNYEEISGVLCHEIAHIKLKHVMKKLVKEIGLSVLISITTGNSGTEIIKEAAKLLSSSAFDRSMEKEADLMAVDYLIKAQINPEPFADFLYKLSQLHPETSDYVDWISTHPDSKERAKYIIEYAKDKHVSQKAFISKEHWDKVKSAMADQDS